CPLRFASRRRAARWSARAVPTLTRSFLRSVRDDATSGSAATSKSIATSESPVDHDERAALDQVAVAELEMLLVVEVADRERRLEPLRDPPVQVDVDRDVARHAQAGQLVDVPHAGEE